jgi:hypothetical protein
LDPRFPPLRIFIHVSILNKTQPLHHIKNNSPARETLGEIASERLWSTENQGQQPGGNNPCDEKASGPCHLAIVPPFCPATMARCLRKPEPNSMVAP